MLKKKVFGVFLLLVWSYSSAVIADLIEIDDGQVHIVNHTLYRNDHVWLDIETVIEPGTHLTVADGAIVGWLTAFNNASVAVTGGIVSNELFGDGNSEIRLINGFVHDLQVSNMAFIDMAGGEVDILASNANSSISVSGGLVNDILVVSQNGTIFLEGDGFRVTDLDGNTTLLSCGDKLCDFGTFVEFRPYGSIQDYFAGTITGVLMDGSLLDIEFRVYNQGANLGTADIVIIPEPATVLLLGLGGMVLTKRKRG